MVDIPLISSNLLTGDRATLARAITLIESSRADHQPHAQAFLRSLLPLLVKANSPAVDPLRGRAARPRKRHAWMIAQRSDALSS